MKTTFIFLSIFHFAFLVRSLAQGGKYRIDPAYQTQTCVKEPGSKYLPVYFNYTKRQLFYNGTSRMDGKDFIGLCRGINDRNIQLQLKRYDERTRNKGILNMVGAACGVMGY